MCVLPTPNMPAAPELPPETAVMKQPDAGAVRSSTGRRTQDRMRAGSGMRPSRVSATRSRPHTITASMARFSMCITRLSRAFRATRR